jgi:predicted outer membrane protein
MNRLPWIIAIAALAGASAVSAIAANIEDATPTPAPILSTEISGSELGFLMDATQRIALLVRLAGLAKTKAVTPEVQAEAATISKEQTAAAAQLKDLAASDHVPLTDGPGDQGEKVLADLRNLSGVKFDKAFIDALADAQDALGPALNTGTTVADPAIKAFAAANLQTLKQERDRIRKLGL